MSLTKPIKSVILKQPFCQVLPMLIPLPLPDPVPRVPDQPVLFQVLVNPRPLDITLLSTLLGSHDHKDDTKQPAVKNGQCRFLTLSKFIISTTDCCREQNKCDFSTDKLSLTPY